MDQICSLIIEGGDYESTSTITYQGTKYLLFSYYISDADIHLTADEVRVVNLQNDAATITLLETNYKE